MSQLTDRIDALTAKLSLEEKVALVTGRDFWNTVPLESIGLRNMLLSDGPSGVRGEFWDERDNSLNLPSATALGSSWSRELASEYGRTLAREADRKGVDVVLGPTINLHRSPLGGRHFEALSEDPVLTGALAAAYTTGMQGLGKGACPKHYIANDFETERFTANVHVDDRTLRELYFRPFEDAIVEGGAWTIMSSYNSVNGSTLTESPLLETPLRTDWGFDGVVMSDWTAVRSLNSAKFEQDLEMPGGSDFWGKNLVEAIKNGEIDEETLNRKIRRLILLGIRVGAIGANGETPAAPKRHNDIAAEGVAFARRAAAEGAVLLENDGVLPVDLKKAGKVALIGHNAKAARTQGGGSATTMPKSVVTPFDALTELLGDNVSYSLGAVVQEGLAELNPNQLVNPVTGGRGVRVEFIGADGSAIYTEDREASALLWLGSQAPVHLAEKFVLTTNYTPDFTGVEHLGFAGLRSTTIWVDGEQLVSALLDEPSGDPFIGLMDPPYTSKPVNFVAGKTVEIKVELDMRNRQGMELFAAGTTFGFEPDKSNPQGLIDQAVANAKAAELAIVVVGTNSKVESEGFDRKSLKLPGAQDALVEAVIAANPNTIVVVNAGSPVELPWRNKARAVLVSYFAGQEMGNALVDLLTGAAEPGGRLPTTWAVAQADLPVHDVTPVDGQISYSEGLHIGYRAWLKAGVKPAYPFGYGLGYTTFSLANLSAPSTVVATTGITVSVDVTNTGSRSGKQVVQVYLRRKNSAIDRPALWLAGFTDVIVAAGETKTVSVDVKPREFAHWDGAWEYEQGDFELLVGDSSANLTLRQTVTLS